MASVMEVRALNCEDLGNFLEAEGFHENILSAFIRNRICGKTFLALTEDDLKELVPVIGDRVHVREILQRERKVIVLTAYISSVKAKIVFYLMPLPCAVFILLAALLLQWRLVLL